MHERPQTDHCDLGLIDDDCTPDMRNAPAATEALPLTSPLPHQRKSGL